MRSKIESRHIKIEIVVFIHHPLRFFTIKGNLEKEKKGWSSLHRSLAQPCVGGEESE
jgi:hypothetical protein